MPELDPRAPISRSSWIVRIAACVLGAALILRAGSMALQALPTRANKAQASHAHRPPAFLLVAEQPGVSAQVVASTITAPLERALLRFPSVERTESRSIGGFSFIRVWQKGDATDALTAESVLAQFAGDLHGRGGSLVAIPGQFSAATPLGIVLIQHPDLPLADLADRVHTRILPELKDLEGIIAGDVVGDRRRVTEIVLDPARLEARRLTPADVARALDANVKGSFSAELPLGKLQYTVAAGGWDEQDLRTLPIRSQGAAVSLGDVGQIVDAAADTTDVLRVDGRRTVGVPLYSTFETPATGARTLDARLKQLERRLPEGATLRFVRFASGSEASAPDGLIELQLRLPTGSRIELTEAKVAEIEQAIQQEIPPGELEFTMAEMGVRESWTAALSPRTGSWDATILVQLRDSARKETQARVEALRSKLTRDPASPVSAITTRMREYLDIAVIGDSLEEGYKVAGAIRDHVGKLEGVLDARVVERLDGPTFELMLDAPKMADLGLNRHEVLNKLSVVIEPRTEWRDSRTDRSIQIRMPGNMSIEDFLNIPIDTPTRPIPLRNVTVLERTLQPVEISHTQLEPTMHVRLHVPTSSCEAVVQQIFDEIRDVRVPTGLRVELDGKPVER